MSQRQTNRISLFVESIFKEFTRDVVLRYKERWSKGPPICAGNVVTRAGALYLMRAGADVVKVFPANILGMKFFKGVLTPMPHLKLMPTSGVNLDNPGQWLQAGACVVGIGSALVDKEMVTLGNFEKVRFIFSDR